MIIETNNAVYDLKTSTKFALIKSEYIDSPMLEISHPIGNPILKKVLPSNVDWNIVKNKIIYYLKEDGVLNLEELTK